MLKKFTLASLLMISASATVWAQKDPQATAILDKVTNQVKASTGIIANYTAITTGRTGSNRGQNRGTISIRGNKYFIQNGNTQIISDGAKVWNYDGGNEVIVSDVENTGNSISPESILNGSFYQSGYNYKLVSSAGNNYKIDFTPTDKRKSITEIVITINKSNNLISNAIVSEKSGNKTNISLSNIHNNANIPATKFAFDKSKHPKVSIVEN